MREPVTIDLAWDLAEVPRVAEQVEALAEVRGWPPGLVHSVNLSVDELITNSIQYGSSDADSPVLRLTLSETPSEVRVEIEDNGIEFDPFEEAPVPELASSLEERAIGGLGVHLVKTMSDEQTYERRDGMNRVTLVFRRAE